MGLDLTKTGGGGWLTDGRHVAKCTGFEGVTANSGSKGVEYQFVQESTGKRAKGTYWTYNHDGSTNKGAWRLRTLAEAAKLDISAIRDFNPSMVVGRTVGIIVEQEGKYRDVVGEFVPTAEDIARSNKEGEESQSQAASEDAQRQDQSAQSGPPVIDDDDCPF